MAEVYRGSDDGNGGVASLDPIQLEPDAGTAALGDEPSGRKRRSDAGKPRGTRGARTAKTGEKVALDLSSMTGMFVGLHALMSERTGVPEWSMSEDEGKQFMAAAQNVMRHYSVETTQKTLDWISFIGTGAGIYGTRLAAYRFRTAAEREAKRDAPNRPAQNGSSNVASFPVVVPGPMDTGEGGGFGG